MKKFVIYSRQSKVSGLQGQMTLETADFTIKHYLNTVGVEGVDYEVVGSFEEIKSSYGHENSRSRAEFNKAVKMCTESNGEYTLVVSTAARLSRNTAHGAQLVEDFDIVIASNPNANKTMKNIMFVFGEEESYQQSERRKAAAAAKRKRCEDTGEKFIWGGNSPQWHKTFQANRANHAKTKRKEASRQRMQPVVTLITDMISFSNNTLTLDAIAAKLNERNITTATGKPWKKQNVSGFIKMYDIKR
jgi:DNA invertase Pin-like site-specific DNA recombinase